MTKYLVLVLTICFSTISMAETCFRAVSPIPERSKLPETVCINSYGLDLVNPGFPEAPFYSISAETSLGSLKARTILKKSANLTYDLYVSKMFVNDSYTCDEVYRSLISINFKVDDKGKTIPSSLNVTGLIGTAADACEDRTQWEQIKYQMI